MSNESVSISYLFYLFIISHLMTSGPLHAYLFLFGAYPRQISKDDHNINKMVG